MCHYPEATHTHTLTALAHLEETAHARRAAAGVDELMWRAAPLLPARTHSSDSWEPKVPANNISLRDRGQGGVKEQRTSVTELAGPRGLRPNANKLQQPGSGNESL